MLDGGHTVNITLGAPLSKCSSRLFSWFFLLVFRSMCAREFILHLLGVCDYTTGLLVWAPDEICLLLSLQMWNRAVSRRQKTSSCTDLPNGPRWGPWIQTWPWSLTWTLTHTDAELHQEKKKSHRHRNGAVRCTLSTWQNVAQSSLRRFALVLVWYEQGSRT